MRIVTWNMARHTTGRSNAVHERAWHYLAALDPDIALVQEASARDLPWVGQRWRVVRRPTRQWGSAVLVARDMDGREWDGGPEGSLERDAYIATAVTTLLGLETVLASVHAPVGRAVDVARDDLAGRSPDDVRLPAYAAPSRKDAAYALLRDRVAGRSFLVAGDWNVARLWDTFAYHEDRHESDFFARAAADGWVDVGRLFHRSEFRTWYRDPDPPYQLDHVFCDPATAGRVTSCDPDPYPAATLRVSDHAPIVLEMALSADAAAPANHGDEGG